MRRVFVVVAAVLASLASALPASADTGILGTPLNPGFIANSPQFFNLGMNTPMAELGVGIGSGGVSGLEMSRAIGYSIVTDLAVTGELAVDQADLARGMQDLLEARARAQQAADVARQTQIGPDGCPTSVPSGTLRGGAAGMSVYQLCADSVAAAATPHAAAAIKWAFSKLGAPYACDGVGRMDPFRFDCSSLVTRAYSEGAGLGTAGTTWAPSTRDIAPWGGVPLAPWASFVTAQDARPGDLIVFNTPSPDSEHVVMLLAHNLMLHTNACGDVAHVTTFTGFGGSFLVARRVDASKA